MSAYKKSVLFVGSFKDSSSDGSVGGQMYACRSLIESELSNEINWILVDSTASSNIISSLVYRLFKALRRIGLVFYYLIFYRINTTLIFTADGMSFIEKGTIAIVAKLFGKKVLLAPRSGFIIDDYKNSVFMRWFIPFVISKIDILICQGESWEVFYRGICGSMNTRFFTLQNWINVEKYNSPIQKKENDKVNILFMSWVDENKGILDIILALSDINLENVQVNIAGNGSAMHKARALVKKFNLDSSIIFLDWVVGNSKIELLNKSEIFLLPSYFEGFPNSLLEAMASSCAVIVSDVGSIKDVVINNINGLVIKPGDIIALRKSINLLISDVEFRNRISENALSTVINNNDIKIVIDKIRTIL